MNLKIGYCPICNETFTVYSDDIACDCPVCDHHVMLHDEEEE